MRPRNPTISPVTVCIGLSLLLHGLLALAIIDRYGEDLETLARIEAGMLPRSAAPSWAWLLPGSSRESSRPMIALDPPAPPPPREPTAIPPKPKPKPPEDPLLNLPPIFGELTGRGTSTHAADGDVPLKGRQGEHDQAYLSLDPEGRARLPDEPSEFTGPIGTNALPGRPIPRGPGGAGRPRIPQLFTQSDPPTATPFGVPPPPIPPAPKLIRRPPIRAAVAAAPPEETKIIGQTDDGHGAREPLFTGPSTRPAVVLIDSRPEYKIEEPADVMTERAPTTRPEEFVKSPDLALPATTPTRIAIDPSMKRPSTQPVEYAADPQGATRGGVGKHPIRDLPVTRPTAALAMEVPLDQQTKHDGPGTPTTLPINPTLAKAIDQQQPAPSDLPVADKSVPRIAHSPQAGNPKPEMPSPGPGGDPRAGAAGTPGLPVPSADPAPLSDSEVHAFSTTGSAIMKAGRIEAKFGVKVKTVSPRIQIKAALDAFTMPTASADFRLGVDATGKVTDVKVLKSTGSDDLDLQLSLAIYRWKFDPTLDPRSGRPVPRTFTFTFSIK